MSKEKFEYTNEWVIMIRSFFFTSLKVIALLAFAFIVLGIIGGGI